MEQVSYFKLRRRGGVVVVVVVEQDPISASLVSLWDIAQFSANRRIAGQDGLQVATNCPRSERANKNALTFLKYSPHHTQFLFSFCLQVGCVDKKHAALFHHR